MVNKMKKKIIILLISIIGIISGCDLNNTPTSKVEELLMNYQMLDNNISTSYTNLTNDETISDNLKLEYQDIIKKQFRNLSYEVKDEATDGNEATITVEITVLNYKDIITKINKNNYSIEEYHKIVISKLKEAKEKITYTINFRVTKDNDEWKVKTLTEEETQKLLGNY